MENFFHHVAIHVVKYDECKKFYYTLGFKMFTEWSTEDGARHCFLCINGTPSLELHQVYKPVTEERIRHFCLHVDDVDAVYNIALTHGAASKISPHTHPLNSYPVPITSPRVAHVYGPDGESIELINWGEITEQVSSGKYK